MKVTKEKLMSEIRAYLLITFGLLIYTFAVTAFLAPHRMVGGGVTVFQQLFISFPER